MHLERLHVGRTPGIDTPFTLEPLEPGINLILGPNGSGKSSTRRALAGCLFPESNETQGYEVDLGLADERGKLTAQLRSRSVAWSRVGDEDAGRPQLPSPLRSSCYAVGVRDLLDDSGGSEEELARAVRREMAGGYDMEALVADGGPFRIKQREGVKETDALEKCRQAKATLALELQNLAEQEDRLAELRETAERARAASQERRQLESALELIEARDEERAARARLESFPAGVRTASSNDAGLLAQLEGELSAAEQRIAEAQAKSGQALGVLQNVGDALDALDSQEHERREAELERLRDTERRIEAARANLAQAEAALSASRAEDIEAPQPTDGVQPMGGGGPTAKDLREFETQLAEIEKLEAELTQLDVRASSLSGRAEIQALGDARGGIEDLRTWLRTPTAEDLSLPAYLYGGGGIAALAGVVGGFVLHPAVFVLSGIGVGFLTTHIMLSQERQGLLGQRTQIETKFNNRPQLDKQGRWTAAAVSKRLDELEREIVADTEATQARGELRELEAKREHLQTALTELHQRGSELSQRLGIDPETKPLQRSELARRLAAKSEAARDVEKARAALDELERERRELEQGLAGFLQTLGFAPASGAAATQRAIGGEALRAALKRAGGAAGERAKARSLREQAESELPTLVERRDAVAAKLEAFYAERGLSAGERAALEALLAELEPFAEARDALSAATRERRRLEAALEGKAELAELSAENLRTRLDAATELAARLDALNEEIGRITQSFESESGRDRMQEAAHAVELAETAAAECRDDLLERAAAGFLLDDTTAEFERTSRPDVLSRAGELFAEFTAHRYDLMVHSGSAGETARFRAKETERGRELGLAQLSDGTRMQLLLAVRIAFAEEAELGEKLPLVLDEAFSMSDNERWAEMVRSLYALAEQGRQILYFSANANEIESWRNLAEQLELPQPNALDLAAARKLEGHEREVTLIPRRAPKAPAVAGKSPEEARELLQVPLPQPHRPVDTMHLFHLLTEDLEVLDVCLAAKVETVGQWRSAYKRRRGAKLAGDHAKAGRIEARTRVAERTVQAWHAGRNRPVGRDELESAGVTPAKLEEVAALLGELEGDPGRLIEALRAKRIKGYQKAKIDRHEEWFQVQGFLDGDRILTDDEIAERAVESAAKDIAAGRTTPDDARLLSLEIAALLDEAAAEQSSDNRAPANQASAAAS